MSAYLAGASDYVIDTYADIRDTLLTEILRVCGTLALLTDAPALRPDTVYHVDARGCAYIVCARCYALVPVREARRFRVGHIGRVVEREYFPERDFVIERERFRPIVRTVEGCPDCADAYDRVARFERDAAQAAGAPERIPFLPDDGVRTLRVRPRRERAGDDTHFTPAEAK